ncbi:uracil-DNA glycosylase [Domibacillus antri]|uniref:Uracil-DNA glycosylase n=1 Tax=Domibacillus antri TaxID=1714264 RepID=A0A1Q8QA46_9BACI|nr:uracil-DNA glycosylase [Domibacillus antri]OLN24210.1 uracil-DNA glycosylase [Domibacillus antri]
MSNEPNCLKCRHFYVTWDPAAPRGCRGYGFKTKQVPSIVVRGSSGHPCYKFSAKAGEKK